MNKKKYGFALVIVGLIMSLTLITYLHMFYDYESQLDGVSLPYDNTHLYIFVLNFIGVGLVMLGTVWFLGDSKENHVKG